MQLLENARVVALERGEIAAPGVAAVHFGQRRARRAPMVEERIVEIKQDGARKGRCRAGASVYSAATVSDPPYRAGRVNASLASRGSKRGNSQSSRRRAV